MVAYARPTMTEPGNPAESTNGAESFDVAEIVDDLRLRVDRRRAQGDYPPDLEDRMSRHFERVRNHPVYEDHLPSLRQAISELDLRSQFTPDRIASSSKSRVGEHYHRLIAQAVARQVAGILDQVQSYVDAVRPILELGVAQLEDLEEFVHQDLAGHVDAALDRLGRREVAGDDIPGELAALRTRVAALEAERSLQAPFDETRLHDRFEGDPAEMADRARHVSELVGGRGPVLDLACGRGELLEVLTAEGVAARGVDGRSDLVAGAVRQGLPAGQHEALPALDEADGASLGAVVMAEGLESLDAQSIADLVTVAATKLAAGGVLILAADNPAAALAAASRAGADPRRRGPLSPEYLSFLCEQVGLTRRDLHWSPTPTGPIRVGAGEAAVADLVSQLNELLFPPTRFTLVASAPSGGGADPTSAAPEPGPAAGR